MRIVYIVQHFTLPWEGWPGSSRPYEFSRRLREAGHDVHIVCAGLTGTSDRATEDEFEGIRRTQIDQYYGNELNLSQRLRAFAGFALTATRVARGLDADLVFATSTPLTSGIPGVLAARKRKVPFVFEVRDLWPEFAVEMGVVRNPVLVGAARWLERRLYHAASRVIALAPGIKDGIVATGYSADRVVVIPNGAVTDLFHPTSERHEDPRFGDPNDLSLVFAGTLGAANGLDAVVDAAGELKRRGEAGIRFVFIGKGGERERLMGRTRSEGLEHSISWIDIMSKWELARHLPRFDVGMMILANVRGFYTATSPNKLFDYLAAGLPVLNNYPGWVADMLTENDCGRVVPPGDAAAFADAVVWMRDHRAELQEMGRRSRGLADARFSFDKLGADFVGALEAVRAEAG